MLGTLLSALLDVALARAVIHRPKGAIWCREAGLAAFGRRIRTVRLESANACARFGWTACAFIRQAGSAIASDVQNLRAHEREEDKEEERQRAGYCCSEAGNHD